MSGSEPRRLLPTNNPEVRHCCAAFPQSATACPNAYGIYPTPYHRRRTMRREYDIIDADMIDGQGAFYIPIWIDSEERSG